MYGLTFLNNINLMCDMICLTKENFLKRHKDVISEQQYNATRLAFEGNRDYYLKGLCNIICKDDLSNYYKQKELLENEIMIMKEYNKYKEV